MSQAVPVIYLLFGDDEFAIAHYIKDIESKLGDAEIASMNISRLDGKNIHPEEILTIAGAMPFLARRRLVILQSPTMNISSKEMQEKFTNILERVPETTGLILVEDIQDREKRKKIQWLLDWATHDPKRTFVKEFSLPKGNQMIGWIQNKVRGLGGVFTPPAAAALASLVGSDTRLATQEIEKLLAYVNYQRSVDADDVEMITADYIQADIFALVDSISLQQSRQAMSLLQKILEQQESMMTFAMIQRQFRLLLQAREVLDHGGTQIEISKQLKVHPFVSEKLNNQARRFDLNQLEMVYRRLLDLDEGIKTGQIETDLALETFVAAFTSQ
jgi:DNA polymerase-3 subunit delta